MFFAISSDSAKTQMVFILGAFGVWYLTLAATAYTVAAVVQFAGYAAAMLPLFLLASSLVQLYLGIVFARALSRIWPFSSTRVGRIIVSNTFLFALAGYALTFLALVVLFFTSGSLALIVEVNIGWAIISALTHYVWIVTVGMVFAIRTRRAANVLDTPFVLFLRRFSTLSDRAVADAVFASTLATRRIVLLVPRRSEPEDWNPATVFMAGVRPWAALRSIPFFLKAPDEHWVEEVRSLITAADIVVVDGSDMSNAIAQEIDLIETHEAWPKTVVLVEQNRQGAFQYPKQHTPKAVIEYSCTWSSAWRGLLAGLVLVIPIGLPITVPIVLFIEWLSKAIGMTPLLAGIGALVISLAILSWLYKTLFMRPAMNHDARHRLREVLILE